MANIFLDLPVPAGNGIGAPVDISIMGVAKTFVIGGDGIGTLNIEANLDAGQLGTWQSLTTFFTAGVESTTGPVRWIRVRVSGLKSGSFIASVGGTDDGASFATLPVPPADGVASPVDVSTLPVLKAVQASGTAWTGTLLVEAQVDDAGAWAQIFSFTKPGIQQQEFVAKNMRVRRVGSSSQAFVTVGASIPIAIPLPPPAVTFIFRPGGLAIANVYTTWPTLQAALDQVQGNKILLFDDSIVSPCVVPARVAPYDMITTEWSGNLSSVPVQVEVVEGATFSKLRKFTNDVRVTFTGATAPVSDFVATGLAPDAVVMDLGAKITCTGTGPFFQNDTVGGQGVLVAFQIGAGAFDTGGTPVFGCSAGSISIFLLAGPLSVLQPGTISGPVGAFVFLYAGASGLSEISESQPAFFGTIAPANITKWRCYSTDIATSNVGLGEANLIVRVDPTGGSVDVTLPPAFDRRGQSIIVKNVSASVNAINILPTGGDTIDGGASGTITSARGSLHYKSDGGADWMAIGST